MPTRPGEIKEIIDVKMGRPRDRSDFDFMEIRKKIYAQFFENSSISIEYYI
jgi:ABC-type nitrate/sulfonate/bicarbonate transport system ATPase subunit